ncbi:MAG: hypothetical protein IPH44_11575 [Myxococcales bacterium]|nr:hypothetical protein [Myxococcales bacterium]
MIPASPTRLLLLPCSARKRRLTRAPALDLYDGPAFQSLRKLVASGGMPPGVLVRIVSAKYGLLGMEDLIGYYDRRIDPVRDVRLIATTRRRLSACVARSRPSEVLCLLGRDYRACLPSSWEAAGAPIVRVVQGPPGSRVRQMLDWLEAGPCC